MRGLAISPLQGSFGDWPMLSARPPRSDWTPPTGPLPSIRGQEVALDTETRDDGLLAERGPGWVYGTSRVVGVSAAWGDRAIYVPIAHPDTENRPREEVVAWADDLFRHNHVVFFNMGYDMGCLLADGATIWPEKYDDASAMGVMTDENWDSNSLDAWCARVGIPGKDETLLNRAAEAFGIRKIRGGYKHGLWRLPARYVGPYAEQDAVATLRLARTLRERIRTDGVEEAYRTELRLIRVVYEMRRRGIRVDTDRAERARARVGEMRSEQLARIPRPAGVVVVTMEDLRSPTRLAKFFDAEGISYPRTAKTGQPSFTAGWLEAHPSPLAAAVRRARQLDDVSEKFLKNYILGFAHRGRVHAEIHPLRSDTGGTVTTRLAYSNPPLQQMPARDPVLGPMVRDVFEAEHGARWYAPDYCFSADTEILTRRGFVPFPELLPDDLCAQVDPANLRLTYAAPLERQIVRYSGPMVALQKITGRGLAVDLLVTPNHKFLLRRGEGWERVAAGSLDGRKEIAPTAGVYEPDKPIRADVRIVLLAVAMQADAAVRRGDTRWRLSKPRKIDRLHRLLGDLGIPFGYRPPTAEAGTGASSSRGTTTVYNKDFPPDLWNWIDRATKNLSERVLELPSDDRMRVLEELPHWDGKFGLPLYSSTSRWNVELMQRLAVTTGRGSKIRSKVLRSGRDFCTLSWSIGDTTVARGLDGGSYDGYVYCVSMPALTCVVRRGGKVIISGQSQQEPRLAVHFAALCKRPGAEDAVAYYRDRGADADFHQMVADIARIPRKVAKIINLGLMYGMGLSKLALSLGLDEDEARELMETYHGRVPWVRGLEEYCEGRAQARGFIRLIDGARRHYDAWEPARRRGDSTAARQPRAAELWPDQPLRRAFTRTSMNSLIQGSAARQTKIAMVSCYDEGLLPMIQMHDELCFSVSEEAVGRRIADIMRECVRLRVPVRVDEEYGPTWGRAKYAWSDYPRDDS